MKDPPGRDRARCEYPPARSPSQAHVGWGNGRSGRAIGGCSEFESSRTVRLLRARRPDEIPRVSLADGKRVPFAGGHESWVSPWRTRPAGDLMFSGGGDGRRGGVWEAGPRPRNRCQDNRRAGRDRRPPGVAGDGKLLASGGNDRAVPSCGNPDAASLSSASSGSHRDGFIHSPFHPDGRPLLAATCSLSPILGPRHGEGRSGPVQGPESLHHRDYERDGEMRERLRGLDISPGRQVGRGPSGLPRGLGAARGHERAVRAGLRRGRRAALPGPCWPTASPAG